MGPHSSTLAWKIAWVEEPGRLQPTGSRRFGHDWATSLSLFIFVYWRRKWQPTPVFLPGESQWRWSLVGCHLWGPAELGSDLAVAAAKVVSKQWICNAGEVDYVSITMLSRSETKTQVSKTLVCNKSMACGESKVVQSCPTLCDPMDSSLPRSSIHGIFQATVLEWVAISFSRRSSQPRDRTQVSRVVGRHFTIWATREDGMW